MAVGDPEAIPEPAEYYEVRHSYFNQGDIFQGLPLPWPIPRHEDELVSAEGGKFHQGEVGGCGLLITPSCCMQAQGHPPGTYAHPVRAIVPIVPLEELVANGTIKTSAVPQLRQFDNLKNYMYLPASERYTFLESVALLWLPLSLHHDQVDGLRVAQLSEAAAQQLMRKLQWFYTGVMDPREEFEAETG